MEWVTCEDIYEESWRRLLEYANLEIAYEAIEQLHGPPHKKQKQNYQKQAKQIRVCLLQAKEYFEASRNSSLFTKPNHLYYGLIGLTSACMLLRGDGKKSLDLLREEGGNRDHGLRFFCSLKTNKAKTGLELLENSYVEIIQNGHFANWYKTLQKVQNRIGTVTFTGDDFTSTSTRIPLGRYNIPDFTEMSKKKEPILNLVKRIPDINSDLVRYGVNQKTASGRVEVLGNVPKKKLQIQIIINEAVSKDVMDQIVAYYQEDQSYTVVRSEISPSVFIYSEEFDFSDSIPRRNLDSRETLHHDFIFFNEEVNTPEIVDSFIICYGLSMCSRYYPDIWVDFIESHCKGAKIVEGLIYILLTKTPLLMLNQMVSNPVTISTHRVYW